MKKFIVFAMSLIVCLYHNAASGQPSLPNIQHPASPEKPPFGGAPVSVAHANDMIQAYLSGSGAASVKSLFIEADTLRQYLSNKNVRAIKFFLARPVSAAASKDADSGRLTLVIAGIDGQNNIVFTPAGEVYDELRPCPTECPDGEAGQDLLPEQ